MTMKCSLTSKTERHLMSMEEKMRKEDKSLSGTSMERPTRDGRSSILTKQIKNKKRDLMMTSVSTSTDHSISDQDFQCTELLKPKETTK
jgi:hypothetical protein